MSCNVVVDQTIKTKMGWNWFYRRKELGIVSVNIIY